MQAHVINLPRHPDRLARTVTRCSAVGLTPSLFSAVDGRLVSVPDRRDELTEGEVGCVLSHRGLLEKIGSDVDDTHLHLVLEDDVAFFPDFSTKFRKIVDWFSTSPAGLVQVGWVPTLFEQHWSYRYRHLLTTTPVARRLAHTIRRSTPLDAPLVLPVRPAWGTHCYLVKPSVARDAQALMSGRLLGSADHYLQALWELMPDQVWRTRFPLAGQDRSDSSSVRGSEGPWAGVQFDSRGRLWRGEASSG